MAAGVSEPPSNHAGQPTSDEASKGVNECLAGVEFRSDHTSKDSAKVFHMDPNRSCISASAKQNSSSEGQVKYEKEENTSNSTTTNSCSFHQWPIRPDEINYMGYGIYLGTHYAACTDFLRANGVTHVLSVGFEHKEPLDDITCKFFTLWEGPGAKERLEEILNSAFSFIDEGTKGHNKILVHCLAGVSRSPTVVMAYLHAKKGFTIMEAFARVALRRPDILPCPELRRFLEQKAKVDDGVIIELDNHPGCYILWPPARLVARKEDLGKFGITFRNCHKDDRENEGLVFWTEAYKEFPPLEIPSKLNSRLKKAVLKLNKFCKPQALRTKVREIQSHYFQGH